MHDFTVWVSYGKWRKNWDIRYCLLHLIHLSSTRLRRCGRILSGICEPYCLITPDLTMRYCPILILIDYIFHLIKKMVELLYLCRKLLGCLYPFLQYVRDICVNRLPKNRSSEKQKIFFRRPFVQYITDKIIKGANHLWSVWIWHFWTAGTISDDFSDRHRAGRQTRRAVRLRPWNRSAAEIPSEHQEQFEA